MMETIRIDNVLNSKFTLMSETIGLLILFSIMTAIPMTSTDQQTRLKMLSVSWVVFVVLSFNSITVEWGRMTADLVDEEDDPHFGLPDLWDGKQVVCVHFPQDLAQEGYDKGRKHIDNDGTQFMTDNDWNETGACIGGFSGFNNGWALFNAAANSTGSDFNIEYTDFGWGIMIDSIGGANPSTMTGDFQGAYWALYHNGALSSVGIADLTLDDDSVITWRVDTW